MTGRLAALMSLGRIGTMELRNRIVHAPMSLSLGADEGTCGDRFLAYYEARARGGVGLINIGTVSVGYPEGAVDAKQIAISHDRYIPSIAGLARIVQKHGAKIMLQLNHNGPQAGLDRSTGRPLAVPSVPQAASSRLLDAYLPEELEELKALAAANKSPVRDPGFDILDEAGIARIVQMFAAAARRAKQAGVDAVEIHGGHGYLLQSFLSPASNLRTDRYGGSLENRARFLIEVVQAVREETGPDYPIEVKIDCAEFGRSNGITPEDSLNVARAVRKAGADSIAVTAYGDMTQPLYHSGAHTPQVGRLLVPYAQAIRNGAGGPIMTAGRIEPAEADRDIAMGLYDFVAMGRKLLADPELPNRLATLEAPRIKPCVYCYNCISQAYFRRPILCPINPEMGHELDSPSPRLSKHVAIVGGGPTGLEAARRLASSGARVTLIEAGPALGGQLRVAAECDDAMVRLLAWLSSEIEALRVTVRLNAKSDAETVRALGADAVIDARGRARAPLPPGVIDAADMAAVAPQGRQIVIIGANAAGLALAARHAAAGKQVHVVDTNPKPGEGVALVRRWRLLDWFGQNNLPFYLNVSAIVAHSGAVSFTDANGSAHILSADAVIEANGASLQCAPLIPGAFRISPSSGFHTLTDAFADARSLARQVAQDQ